MQKDAGSASVMSEVSSYISKSGKAELPAEVIKKAKCHILDTLGAIVSGSKFKPGEYAKKYAKSQGGVEEAQVVGSPFVTSAINAALANGMMAHADETDDSNESSLTHPGCAIVPAALAVSEREKADGMGLVKGVVTGYDIGCRMTKTLGVVELNSRHRCTHSNGGTFGAAAAAASIMRLDEKKVGQVMDYAAQQASGLTYYTRDPEHIEKAFVFGGMPARNGVTAAVFVHTGFTGVSDPFSGENNFLNAFSLNPRPERLAEDLGKRYEVMFTNIKKFAVGSPIQAPLDAILLLREKHGFTAEDVESIVVRLPAGGVSGRNVVHNRDMPDINLQHILAVALLDGDLTFEAAHSYERMKDPAVLKTRECIRWTRKPELGPFEITIEITTRDGVKFNQRVEKLRGTSENPMTKEEVEKKCSGLLAPVLGADRSQELIDRIWNLEQVSNMRTLRPLLSA